MRFKTHGRGTLQSRVILAALCLLPGSGVLLSSSGAARAEDLALELKSVPYKIVYETWQNDNWELFVVSADGKEARNLTQTPDVNELYPHASPDGTKICFVCDEGRGSSKVRNVYVMKIDGTDRQLVARNARQPCWKPDSSAIAYLKGEVEQFSYTDYATKGVWIYDLATGRHRPHPNKDLYHLYNLCWSPDGKWFVSTVHAGMGYEHAIIAFQADGTAVYNLEIPGCRPDISPDGKHIAWGASDWVLRVGDLDFSQQAPRVVNARDVVTSDKPNKIYHVDWSPDGKYIAYSRGPDRKILGLIPEIVGAKARGWNIGVADATQTNRTIMITSDGNCDKEPDWIPLAKGTTAKEAQ